VTGAGLGGKQCGAGWEGLRGECGLEVCGCGAGEDKNFNTRRTLSWTRSPVSLATNIIK